MSGQLRAGRQMARAEAHLKTNYPFMRPAFSRMFETFGASWATDFERFLDRMFGDDDAALELALDGYVLFAMASIRLQKQFERDRRYVAKSYEDAAKAVYHNADYMTSLYLPGILLSNYLWPHHYRHKDFFTRTFVPLIERAPVKAFYDVGFGTGFYSRLILEEVGGVSGIGFDVSAWSRKYATHQMDRFGCATRYDTVLQDVMERTPQTPVPFVISIEVLEHLPDPVRFLSAVRRMLAPGGTAFISAAIAAPNEDHIHQYDSADEVIGELQQAEFKVEQYFVAAAYPPKRSEAVPMIGGFIVT